jgi:ParB family chromosome partitioning protein
MVHIEAQINHLAKEEIMAGKSLKVQAEAKVEGVKKRTTFQVDPRILQEEEGFNLRDYDDPDVVAHIESFAESYATGRYVPPLLVRVRDDGSIVPVEGHCRRRGALLAIKLGAQLPFVDCEEFKGGDSQRVGVMLRSAEGLKLKPMKVALGYLRLQRMGMSNAEIAQDQGKTPARVEQMLLLANANSDVQQLVKEGKVAAEAAIEALRSHGEKAGEYLTGKFNEATERGEKKVTRGSLKDWVPAPKVVTGLMGSVQTVVSALDKGTLTMLAKYEAMSPDQLKAELVGKKVEIDAAALLELIKANGAVVDAKKVKETKQSQAKANASQMSIEGAAGEDDKAGE